MNLYDRPITAFEACQPVGGMNARDQRSGNWSMGIKDCRTSKRQAVRIRVKSRVELSAGYVAGRDSTIEVTGETRKQKRAREYFAQK